MTSLKLIFALGTLMLLGMFAGCSSTKPVTTTVSLNGATTNDVLDITSTGYGKDDDDATYDALKRAMDMVLFNGLPQINGNSTLKESPVKDPLVEDKQTAMANNKQFFEDLYSKTMLYDFYQSSSVVSASAHGKDMKAVKVRAKLNLRNLRRKLENAGVIRKFGF